MFCASRYAKCANYRCSESRDFCKRAGDPQKERGRICSDNSDEILCTCESHRELMTCPGGSNFTDCIPKVWMCDGYTDCPEASDEDNCKIHHKSSGTTIEPP